MGSAGVLLATLDCNVNKIITLQDILPPAHDKHGDLGSRGTIHSSHGNATSHP
jgi:hypothetical protein